VELVGAWTETDVGRAAPVGRVVLRAITGPGEVRDFVMLETGAEECLVGIQIIVLVPFVGRLAHQSTVAPLAQRRCWLRRQAVKRDVRRLQGERRGYVVRPAARHLVR